MCPWREKNDLEGFSFNNCEGKAMNCQGLLQHLQAKKSCYYHLGIYHVLTSLYSSPQKDSRSIGGGIHQELVKEYKESRGFVVHNSSIEGSEISLSRDINLCGSRIKSDDGEPEGSKALEMDTEATIFDKGNSVSVKVPMLTEISTQQCEGHVVVAKGRSEPLHTANEQQQNEGVVGHNCEGIVKEKDIFTQPRCNERFINVVTQPDSS